MALSESEQKMLREIETSLYADDPSFVSSVRNVSEQSGKSRANLQVLAIGAIGVALMIAGVFLRSPGILAGFPFVSLVGVLMVFGAGIVLIRAPRIGEVRLKSVPDVSTPQNKRGKRPPGGFSSRMGERFNGRFD